MRTRNALIVFVGLAALVAGLAVVPSGAQTDDDDNGLPTWQHAAKFICGTSDSTSDQGPVLAGEYATAINVHNPNSATVKGTGEGPSTSPSFSRGFRKKALVLFPPVIQKEGQVFEVRQAPGPWVRPPNLPSDWGFEIDCPDIRQVLLGDDPRGDEAQLIKGFIVIEAQSRLPLDVVAAYTTLSGSEFAPQGDTLPRDGGTQQNTVEIETIQPKKIRSG